MTMQESGLCNTMLRRHGEPLRKSLDDFWEEGLSVATGTMYGTIDSLGGPFMADILADLSTWE